MTEFTIQIAGLRVGVSALYDSTRDFFAGYLCDGTPRLTVAVTEADLAAERSKSGQRRHSNAYLETITLQRKLAERLFAHNVLLFHGSAVAVDGQCYIFTALSGTGKSTHTRLWRELLGDRAVMVNDDKPFLGIGPEGITVHGSPWDGKHHLSANISMPLKAICILERGTENSIRAVSAREALLTLLQQSHRPADPRLMGKFLELLDGLTAGTAFYRLKCTPEIEAAVLSYGVMSGKSTKK